MTSDTEFLTIQHASFLRFFEPDGLFNSLIGLWEDDIKLDGEHSIRMDKFEIRWPENMHQPQQRIKKMIEDNETLAVELVFIFNLKGVLFPVKEIKRVAAVIPFPTADSEFIVASRNGNKACRYTMAMPLSSQMFSGGSRNRGKSCKDTIKPPSLSEQRSLRNRRVKLVGDLLLEHFHKAFQNFFTKQLPQLWPFWKIRVGAGHSTERTNHTIRIQGNLYGLIPPKFLQSVPDRLFNPAANPLFQLLDTTNPVAEISQKRRLTLRGPGGIPANGLFLPMRDAHRDDFGRLCPVETPQGAELGCVLYLARGARVNEKGIIEARVNNKEGEEVFLPPGAETTVAAPGNTAEDGFVQARTAKRELFFCKSDQVTHWIGMPDHILGYAASLIPFFQHNDANRALMGANMMKQAVAIEGREHPLVQTGVEEEIGKVFPQSRFVNDGVLCLGCNLLTGYMPWDLSNYEDAFVISERLKVPLTHEEEEEIIIDEVYLQRGSWFEEITADNPYIQESARAKLDANGVIRQGLQVNAGDVLVSKVRINENSKTDDITDRAATALLQAVFGATTESRPAVDASVRAPASMTAIVKNVRWEIRETWKKILEKSGRMPEGATAKDTPFPDGVHRRLRITMSSKRPLAIGDKLTGRHGNKGVVGKILPEREMPYFICNEQHCSDAQCVETRPHRHLEILINPLTVTGRMNLGQLYETTLGWIAAQHGAPLHAPAFSQDWPWEKIERELEERNLTSRQKILFIDRQGVTNEVEREVTIGCQYFMKLKHFAEDKIKARQRLTVSQLTGQPVVPHAEDPWQRKLLASQTAQRQGEMEVWALQGHGAWNILDEFLLLKSDDERLARLLKEQTLWPEKGRKKALAFLNNMLKGKGIGPVQSTDKGLIVDVSGTHLPGEDLAENFHAHGFVAEPLDNGKFLLRYDPLFRQPRRSRAFIAFAQYCRVLGLELEGLTPEGEYFSLLSENRRLPLAGVRLRLATDDERWLWAGGNVVTHPGTDKNGLWSDSLFGDTRDGRDRGATNSRMAVIRLEVDVLNPLFFPLQEGNEELKVPTIRNLLVLPKHLRPEKNHRNPAWLANVKLPAYEDDLNVLYSKILHKNQRIVKFRQDNAPAQILENEKKQLRRLVQALLVNHKIDDDTKRKHKATAKIPRIREKYDMGPSLRRRNSYRPLQSILSRIIGYQKGKDGIFRSNLLGKRVDFSGRAVIVPNPDLGIDEAGIPFKIAQALFRDLLLGRILEKEIPSIRHQDDGTAVIIEDSERQKQSLTFFKDKKNQDTIRKHLEALADEYLVLLNRAPSLHRLSILAFTPRLHEEGDVIRLNPYVCAPFNADFDGDTMSVFLPTRPRARVEAATLLPSRRLRSPASGELNISYKKDITLGWHLLEKEGTVSSWLNNLQRKGSEQLKEGTILLSQEIRPLLNRSGITIGVADFILLPELPISLYREIAERTGSDPNAAAPMILQKTAEVREKIKKAIADKNREESLRVILDSGATKVDMMQLSGFRGVMRRLDDGEDEFPVCSNLARGMSPVEFFLSCHGSRAGLADKGLVIQVAGDFTNNLIQALQAQRIIEKDCDTREGFCFSSLKEGGVMLPLRKRIAGRFLAEDVIQGHEIIPAGTLITGEMADKLERQVNQGGWYGEIKVRSPLTCRGIDKNTDAWRIFRKRALGRVLSDDMATSPGFGGNENGVTVGELLTEESLTDLIRRGIRRIKLQEDADRPEEVIEVPQIQGICQKCYGVDLATGVLPAMRHPVGVIAGQSIGEAGSQMTLRTFHTGGTAEEGDQSIEFVKKLFSLAKHPIQCQAPADGTAEVLKESGNGLRWLRVSSDDFQWNLPFFEGFLAVNNCPKPWPDTEGSDADKESLKEKISFKSGRVTIQQRENVYHPDIKTQGQSFHVGKGERILLGNQGQNALSLLSMAERTGRLAAAEYLLANLQKIYRSFSEISDQHFEVILRTMLPASGTTPLSLIQVGRSQEGMLARLAYRDAGIALALAALTGETDYLLGLKARIATGTILAEDPHHDK